MQVSIQIALAGFLFFYTDMMFTLVKGLVIDSHISFDISNLSSAQRIYLFFPGCYRLYVHDPLYAHAHADYHFYQALPGVQRDIIIPGYCGWLCVVSGV